MNRRWQSFFDGIGLEYIPNEKIFQVGDKKIRPAYYLPQLNSYFSVIKPENKEKCVNREFCQNVEGFGLLTAFGDPHDMDMKLFSECYRDGIAPMKKCCASVYFSGYLVASTKGRKYYNLGLTINKTIDNLSIKLSIKGFGYSDASGSIHAIPADITYDRIEKPAIFETYDDKDLEPAINDHFYIKSKFVDRETVKDYGGKWDPDAGMWYMTDTATRERCKRALAAIDKARAEEKELKIQEGWNLVKQMVEETAFSALPTKKQVDKEIDRIWKEVKEEYKFTKKEIRQYVEETIMEN